MGGREATHGEEFVAVVGDNEGVDDKVGDAVLLPEIVEDGGDGSEEEDEGREEEVEPEVSVVEVVVLEVVEVGGVSAGDIRVVEGGVSVVEKELLRVAALE